MGGFAESKGRQQGQTCGRLLAVTALLTLAAHAPLSAQDAHAILPPARVTQGPALPPALIRDLQERVRRAIVETARFIEASPAPIGAATGAKNWRRTSCELRDVAIELESGYVANSGIVATVGGVARTSVLTGFSSRRAAERGAAATQQGAEVVESRFAFLYARTPAGWRLVLAKSRPERASATDQGEDWRDLWSDDVAPPQQHACIRADVWRRLGER
jgi:hypothetical protein